MTERDLDSELERILRQCRPAGPPEHLRERVLSSAHSPPGAKPARTWRVWAFRAAVAAVIVLGVGLRLIPTWCLVALVIGAPAEGF